MVEDGLPSAAMVRFNEIELKEPDFNKFVALAHGRGPWPASVARPRATSTGAFASVSSGGRTASQTSCAAVLADETGSWGALTLLRETKRPLFTPTEVRFVASLAEPLADGLRRALVLGDATVDGDDAGLVVLAPDNTIEMSNRAADRWLDELDATGRCGELPFVVHSVATRTGHADDGVARGGSVRTPDIG